MAKKTEFGYQLVDPIKLTDGHTISQIVVRCPSAKDQIDFAVLKNYVFKGLLEAKKGLEGFGDNQSIDTKNKNVVEEDQNMLTPIYAGLNDREKIAEFIGLLTRVVYNDMAIYYDTKKCWLKDGSDTSIVDEIKDKISLLDIDTIFNKYILFFLMP